METKITKLLLSCCLVLCGLATKAQGLQGVIVEDYTTITAADAAFYNGLGSGSYTMAAGMKCYRVYIDMAPNYLLNSVFGTTANPLNITSTAAFFNDDNWGSQFPGETRRLDEGLAFDSWITIGRAAKGSTGAVGCTGVTEQLGVLRAADTNGNLTMCNNYSGFGPSDTDGHMPGAALDVNTVGITLPDLTAFTTNGTTFNTTGSWALLPAQPGVELAGENRVLIGQFTTSGDLSFHINVSVAAPGGGLEFYTWSTSESGSTVSPLLTYPVACTAAQITSATSNSPICSTATLNLDVVATGTAPITYLWTGVGTITNGGTPNATVTGAATGNYNIAVSNACGNANQDVAVVVNTATNWYADTDGDGFGAGTATLACAQPPGTVANNTDQCPTDGNKQVPGACGCGVADVATTYYADMDGDGFGDPASPQAGFTCTVPPGFVGNNTDLCPTDGNKQAPGACGCGVADVATTYYADTDGDGFGDSSSPQAGFTCTVPVGFVSNNTDNCPGTFGLIGDPCDDLNAGTSGDVINASCVCIGSPVNCDDGDACTIDSFDGVQCVHTPIPTDDGDACTTDACVGGTVTHTPINCDDSDACTTDGCTGGTCTHTPINCDDGDACTTDGCTGGTCTHTPINCDDSDACTTDGCTGGTCTHTPINCDDSDACTTDGCAGGICTHTPVNCDDGDPCTTDSCDPVLGCQHVAPVTCDDGDPCTTDTYDCGLGLCVYTPIVCNDGDACTTDACVGGVCEYTPIPTSDGDPCTVDACVGGVVSHTPMVCNDSDACTTDACVAGICIYTPIPTDDGDPCTIDACVGGTVTHTPMVCNDGNVCTTDACVGGICVYTNVADGTSCGASSVCIGGVCTPIGGCTENLFFDITLDNFGSQITVELRDQTGTTTIDQSGPYPDGMGGTVVSDQFCVPAGCYKLYVFDSGNDGISGGGYVLKDAVGRRLLDANGLFAGQSVAQHAFCVPTNNLGLITGSCDRTNWIPNSVVYCNNQPGASAYQFHWFDPHGSYSRFIQVSSPNMKPKQCITNPIPQSMDLNVRVRALVGGNYTEWGRVCRARVNPTPASLPSLDGGGSYSLEIAEDGVGMSLYPNPNRENTVHMVLTGLDEQATVVTLDVYDMFGKRVHTEQFTVEGGEFNYAMQLGNEFSSGMYLFNLTVGDQVHTQRLIRQ